MTELSGLAADIALIIGVDLTMRLLEARGGTQITIPQRVEGSVLAGLIGDEAASLLRDEFGAGNVVLPMGPGRGVAARRARAKRMLAQGASVREVALACDLHTRTVEYYKAGMRDDGDADQLTFGFDD